LASLGVFLPAIEELFLSYLPDVRDSHATTFGGWFFFPPQTSDGMRFVPSFPQFFSLPLSLWRVRRCDVDRAVGRRFNSFCSDGGPLYPCDILPVSAFCSAGPPLDRTPKRGSAATFLTPLFPVVARPRSTWVSPTPSLHGLYERAIIQSPVSESFRHPFFPAFLFYPAPWFS